MPMACSLHLSDPLQIGGKYWAVSSMRGSMLEKMHHPWPNDWRIGATRTKLIKCQRGSWRW